MKHLASHLHLNCDHPISTSTVTILYSIPSLLWPSHLQFYTVIPSSLPMWASHLHSYWGHPISTPTVTTTSPLLLWPFLLLSCCGHPMSTPKVVINLHSSHIVAIQFALQLWPAHLNPYCDQFYCYIPITTPILIITSPNLLWPFFLYSYFTHPIYTHTVAISSSILHGHPIIISKVSILSPLILWLLHLHSDCGHFFSFLSEVTPCPLLLWSFIFTPTMAIHFLLPLSPSHLHPYRDNPNSTFLWSCHLRSYCYFPISMPTLTIASLSLLWPFFLLAIFALLLLYSSHLLSYCGHSSWPVQ